MSGVSIKTVISVTDRSGSTAELDEKTQSDLLVELIKLDVYGTQQQPGGVLFNRPIYALGTPIYALGTPDMLERHVIALVVLGRKIDAMAAWRKGNREFNAMDWGLKESKDFVEELERNLLSSISVAKKFARDGGREGKEPRNYEEPPKVIRTDVQYADDGLAPSEAVTITNQQGIDSLVDDCTCSLKGENDQEACDSCQHAAGR